MEAPMFARSILKSVVTCIAAVGTAFGVTMTIDAATEYQTIEGFGGFGGKQVWWSSGPFHDATYLRQTLDDLGITILRDRVPATFELSNDNGDPRSLDLRGFNFTNRAGHHAAMGERLPLWRAMKQNGLDKFILSYWSPPAWMKTNNDIENGGELKRQAYDEFAEYCVASVKVLKDSCGIDVYALSVQNEPAFEEPYVSCVYTAEQYRDLVKVVGARLHEEYPNVKLFGAEDMLKNWTRQDAFPGPLMADPVSREHLDILAVHGYSDGVHPTPSSQAASMWSRASQNCRSVGKPLWMTETSGFGSTWSGAMELAEAIYAALKFGKVSAWVFWTISAGGDGGYSLISNGTPNKLFYASKHYYRYIRPGAVMIDIDDSGDEHVFAVAFNHKQDRQLTVVLLNAGGSAASVSLAAQGLPGQLRKYVSTSTKQCTDEGTVTSGAAISLDANSVTTLVGTGYAPPSLRVTRTPSQPYGAGAAPVQGFSYALDGRRVHGPVRAGGVYYVRSRDRTGDGGRGALRVRLR
ncbi:MAG: hypothetical protein GF331_18290 [Chitinivibrionales bacterium]|nr:hypothetical protein [Chitinivibrionales bacterium]